MGAGAEKPNAGVRILIGDVREQLATLADASVDCVVTSPPYWGLRDYGVAGQIGLEPTLGEHLAVMVDVFRDVRRVMKPEATLWLNYGDCYATKPNGRSAADTKAKGNDDRTFRDKPMDTTGAIYRPGYEKTARSGASENCGNLGAQHGGRVAGYGPVLKPKDLCLIPERLAIALQEDGWWVRAKNVWGKTNPMPDSSGKYRPSAAHEMVWMLSKSAHCYYDAEAVALPSSPNSHARTAQNVAAQVGSNRANGGAKTNGPMKAVKRTVRAPRAINMDGALNDDPAQRETRYLRQYEPAPLTVWEIGSAPFSEAHFATFPPELAERCILAGCPRGGVVLDPFGGAGTVGLVAGQLERSAILIELNPGYAAIAARRLKAGMVKVSGGDSRRGLEALPLLGGVA